MAYCSNALAGIKTTCDGSLGGIKTVYLTPFSDDIFKLDANATGDTGTVTGISSGVSFYRYDFKNETSTFTSTLNRTNGGGVYVESDINLVFSRMDAKKRLEMNALALSDLAGVVVDNNDKWFAVGTWLPLNANAGTGETGTAFADANQYTCTLHGADKDFPPLLTDAAITAVKNATVEDNS